MNRKEAMEREERGSNAARTAAVNLAILATTQIHELHVQLKDEARRKRLGNVSPSRTVVTNEHLLVAFPIQSLDDAEAMVAFAYFPGALATAAEIYGNLETAVRAADESERKHVFADFAQQMERLDRTAKRRAPSHLCRHGQMLLMRTLRSGASLRRIDPCAEIKLSIPKNIN